MSNVSLKASSPCYCAFCRTSRIVYGKKHLSALDVGLVVVASALLSFLIWQDFDPRALMFIAFGIGSAEIFVLLRRRFSLRCPRCGFDPVLYKRDPAAASRQVESYRDLRRDDPLAAFLPPPHLTLVRPARKSKPKLIRPRNAENLVPSRLRR